MTRADVVLLLGILAGFAGGVVMCLAFLYQDMCKPHCPLSKTRTWKGRTP